MIRLELTIDRLDYGALIEYALPMLRSSGHPLGRMLAGGMSAEAVKRWAAAMPTTQKEQMVAELLNANRDTLLELMAAALGKQGIPVQFSGGKASIVKSR